MNTQTPSTLSAIYAGMDSAAGRVWLGKDPKRSSADLRAEKALIVFMYTKLNFERNPNVNYVF